jgi:hypothetical protein
LLQQARVDGELAFLRLDGSLRILTLGDFDGNQGQPASFAQTGLFDSIDQELTQLDHIEIVRRTIPQLRYAHSHRRCRSCRLGEARRNNRE